jgi:hypothetical protein
VSFFDKTRESAPVECSEFVLTKQARVFSFVGKKGDEPFKSRAISDRQSI